MSQDEFVDYKWLHVDQALQMYEFDQLALFVPQVNLLTSLLTQNLGYDELINNAKKWQVNPLSYLTNKGLMITLSTLEAKDQEKQFARMFEKSDFDKDREVNVWTDETYISQRPGL